MIPKQIIIHHSASSRDKTTIKDINDWHFLRWPDFISSLGFNVGYHYVITGEGKTNQTRRDNELGAHCIPNEGKIGICLTGNFEIEKPTPEQLISLENLISVIKKNYQLNDECIFAHREKSRTICPGKNLFEWIVAYRKISFLKRQIYALLEKIKEILNR